MKPEQLRALLIAQAPRIPYRILDEGQAIVTHWGQRATLFLTRSAEYWALRTRPDPSSVLVICWEHNAYLPCPVFSLSEGYSYDPFSPPTWFDFHHKRTKRTAPVFRSALLTGIQEAYEQLAALPRSTRQRYLRSLASRGRPREAKWSKVNQKWSEREPEVNQKCT
jgi:hypothetical protein